MLGPVNRINACMQRGVRGQLPVPPVKLRRILISRLIFFEATGLRTLMMHLSEFSMSSPWNTCNKISSSGLSKSA